jgi:hypothetical protein
MNDGDAELEEGVRLLVEARERRQANLGRVRYRELEAWFSAAPQLAAELRLEPEIIVAFSGAGLHLDARWSGVLVLGAAAGAGHAWINEVEGAAFGGLVVMRAGDGPVPTDILVHIAKLLREAPEGGLVSVPRRACGDSPTLVRVQTQRRSYEVRVDADDDGAEPALALARLLRCTKQEIRLTEAHRYAVPDRER